MRGASFTATTKRSRRAVRSRRSPCRLRSPAGCWRWRRPAPMGGACGLAIYSRLRSPLRARARSSHRARPASPPRSPPSSKTCPASRRPFCPAGSRPGVGATPSGAALAAPLGHPAQAGLDVFSRGDVGREIAGDLDRVGSPVTRADLERCRATLPEPLSVELDAGHAFNTPPPTQGLASLIILALFERLRIGEGEGFDHIHGLVEATKRAFGGRDRVITDPDDLPHPVDRYLDAKFLDAEALTIDRRKAARWPVPAGEGGTVWMGAADASGLVVSYVQ